MEYNYESDFEEVSPSGYDIANVRKCEYCQRTMNVRSWRRGGTEMRSYDYKGHFIWRCSECATDMINKYEGKDV